MPFPLILASALASRIAAPAAIDVSKVTVGPAVAVTELDLGKLKGELRQLSWSTDARELHVETADGSPPSERLHHTRTQRVAAAKDATLPAWSADGAHLAWAQKTARKKYMLMVAPVGQ